MRTYWKDDYGKETGREEETKKMTMERDGWDEVMEKGGKKESE